MWLEYVEKNPECIAFYSKRPEAKLLDCLEEIMPIIFSHDDKYLVIGRWLKLAKHNGLITISEFNSLRSFFARYFF